MARAKKKRTVVVPPSSLHARRFEIEGDEYVLLEFPWPATKLPKTLSVAERDVTRLATEGRSIVEIAKARGTSEHTVSNQLRAVYKKLGISSRAELVRACRHGKFSRD
jgi:DNA-binding CsgD family transcriptional regulator